MMFEPRHQPLLPRAAFVQRLVRYAALSGGIVFGSLLLGVLGYHIFEGQDWLDALLNASMILGGMGPVGEIHTSAGKVFASCYALYSGMVFLIAAGVIFAPIFHRFMHRFHLEPDATAPGDGGPNATDGS